MTEVRMKFGPKGKAQMVKVNYAVHKYAYVMFGDVWIVGQPAEIAELFRLISEAIKPGTLATRTSLPDALTQGPEIAWPWLVKHCAQLFEGINLSSEPYAHYLKSGKANDDLSRIAHLESPSQADIAEALFGDRTKTGGSYRRRILAVLEARNTTTTPQKGEDNDSTTRKAA